MGTLTVNATNGQTVAAGASYTVPYPAGKSAADYLATGAKITTSDGSIYSVTVSFGASSITITNPTGRAIASGGFDYLDLNNAGIVARFGANGESDVLLGPQSEEVKLVSSTTNLLTGVVEIATDKILGTIHDIRAFGAKCDGRYVADANITTTAGAAAATITSATMAFTADDIGKRFVIHGTFVGAGAVAYQVTVGAITAVAADGLSCTGTTAAATTAITGNTGKLMIGTDDAAAIAAAVAAVDSALGGQIFIPAGRCLTSETISLSPGVHLVGVGKPSGRPDGFMRYGSSLIFTGFSAGDFVTLSGVGSSVRNVGLDACKKAAFTVRTAATQTQVVNSTLGRGTTNSLKFDAGSSIAQNCEIYGGFDPNGSPLLVPGDTCVIGCLIYGAGLNKATAELQSVTDDCQFIGNHLYRGGWGPTEAQVAGANLLFSQGSLTDSAGGVIVGNTFDSCEGDHIVVALYSTNAGTKPISALTISNNQFYQRTPITTNTYSCIRFTVGNTGSNNVSIRGISISGNVAKGGLLGEKYKSFIHWNINATYGSVIADSIVGNTADNCAALYTNGGGAHTPAYTAGNCTIDGTGTVVVVG